MKLRKCVVADEDLDGLSSLSVRNPGIFDDEYRLVPVDAIVEYEQAHDAWRAAEERLATAWANARVVKRRKRKELDE